MKITKQKALSVMESALFASPEPMPVSAFQTLFEGELSLKEIKSLIEELRESYQSEERGIRLDPISKGWQLRSKPENREHLLRRKARRPFRLSGPALETLSIVAYKQPCSKHQIDEIRGVESGHLLRTLMEKGLISFAGKSALPGKPSLYKSSPKFLEVFGFNSLKDLPSEEEIAELLPSPETAEKKEGIRDASKDFPEGAEGIDSERDERENQRLKEKLKSIPAAISFLNEEKNPEEKNLKEKHLEGKNLKEKNPEEKNLKEKHPEEKNLEEKNLEGKNLEGKNLKEKNPEEKNLKEKHPEEKNLKEKHPP